MKYLRRFPSFLAILIAVPLALFLCSGLFGNQVTEEQLTMAEDALHRAAVECYALEGFYPTKLSYLTSHYGVTVNETLYYVDYQYVASNLMPDITVIPLN